MLMKKGLVVFSVPEVVFIRIFFGFVALLPFSVCSIKSLSKKQIEILTLIGIVETLIPMFCFAISLVHVDSGLDGILGALTPVYVLFLGYIFFRDRICISEIVGVLFCVVGTMLIFIIESRGVTCINHYLLIGMLGNILYGCSSNLVKRYCSNIGSVCIVGVSLFAIGILSGVFCVMNTDIPAKIVNNPNGLKALLALAFVGIINLGFANVLFTIIIKRESPMFVSVESVLSPIFAVLLGIIDGERLNYVHFLGFLMMIIGIFYLNRKRREHSTCLL